MGLAKTNAKVVIKQNGFVIHQVNVAPGPFLIQDLNPTSISGDLLVTIEENDGFDSKLSSALFKAFLFYNVKDAQNIV